MGNALVACGELATLVMLKSAFVAVTTAVLELFPGVGSLVADETVAVFEKVPVGGAVMLMVIGLAGPTARVGIVHVTVPATWLHVQPVPVAETKEGPTGSTSDTLTVDAEPGPALLTFSV